MPTATRWTAGENKLKQHLTDPTSASSTMATTGMNGTDIGISIFLGGTRVLWLFGDSFWVQAGQTRGSLKLLHNAVALQTGLDLSTCTYTYYQGGTSTNPLEFFFPEMRDGQPMGKYPMGGIMLDDRVLIVGMLTFGTAAGEPANFNTTMSGMWGTIYHGAGSGAPTSWAPQNVYWGAGHDSFHLERQFIPACNPIDPGDGWIYFYCFGPSQGATTVSPTGGEWAVFRADRTLVKNGDMSQVYWWDGAGRWLRDYVNPRSGGRDRRRVNVLGFDIHGSDQLGGVHIRSDGQWQLTNIPTGWFGAAPTVNYSLTSGASAPKFSTNNLIFSPDIQPGYTPPNGGQWWLPTITTNPAWGDFIYGAYSYPEQTWSGKAAGDQLIGFSRNRMGNGSGALSAFGDSLAYWPEFYKVTGIP